MDFILTHWEMIGAIVLLLSNQVPAIRPWMVKALMGFIGKKIGVKPKDGELSKKYVTGVDVGREDFPPQREP